ncbi:unnamed protein product [Caenorhabditis auriculariae]|uniref:Major facilitator superfamily (MFS) profile domain-containing protein n=1 Tax=Caenorhabditis auriculariae TaxID=2777116 RepID=A0A8S1HT40_9PELO|nr:unnamed protein product [Caenorhabditis auriculariae]
MISIAPRGKMLKSLALFSVLGATVNFQEGYANSYPNTAYLSFQQLFNDSYIHRGVKNGLSETLFTWLWSLALYIWFIGYLLGTFLTPLLTERYGRKISLLVANLIAVCGSSIGFVSAVCKIPELFFVSRLVASTSSGLSFGSLILFLQETTSTEYRGLMSFFSETTFILCNVLGIAFGMNAIFGDNLPVLTGIAVIPAIIATLLCIPLKETPKFLLLNRNDRSGALKSLEFYQGNKEDNDEILDEMLLEAPTNKKKEPVWRSVYTVLVTPHLRHAFFIGCAALQVIVGIWAIVYLSTDLLSTLFTEDEAQMASLIFIIANFCAGLCGMAIVERFGRRPLVLWLGSLNTLSLALYVLFDQLAAVHHQFRWGTIAAMVLNGVTYGLGLGPIAFFITSELVSQQYRSVVQSMVFAVNTAASFAFSFATLPAFDMFKSWSFIPLFIVPSCISLLFLYFKMPETKGREVHDIVDELWRKTSTNPVDFEAETMTISTSSSSLDMNHNKKSNFTNI